MNDEREPEGPDPAEGAEDDMGAPLETLFEQLLQPPPAGFLASLRHKIERRTLTSQIVTLSFEVPKIVVIEILEFFFQLFSPPSDDQGGSR